MIALPFKRLRQIEQQIRQKGATFPLEGLVLVLTPGEEDGGLLVYLDDQLPVAVPSPWSATALSALQEDDLLRYDGLTIGYDALDLVFPLLVTHGPFFYPIRRLFATLGRLDLYRENARHLARALYQHAQPSDRRDTKVVELLLPIWLEQSTAHQAIALALHRDDLPAYLSGERSPCWLSLSDLERSVGRKENWLLTFAEVALAFPEEKGLQVTEWRHRLRENQADDLLTHALTQLAHFFWRKAEHSHDEALRRQAYALALERWLPEKGDGYLVAVLPCTDFKRFCEHGDALFISRVPVIYSRHPHRLALDALIEPRQVEVDRKGYCGPWFALQPLAPGLHALAGSEPMPLEQVWYLSGDIASLANSFLGLAHDLAGSPPLKVFQVSLEQICLLALRGVFLVGLSDPWSVAWQGRYYVLLDQAYRILDDVLLVAEKTLEHKGLQALRMWCNCYCEEEISHSWNELRETVRGVGARADSMEKDIKDVGLRKTIGDLVQAVHLLAGERPGHVNAGHSRPINIFLKELATGQDISFVSDYFWAALANWYTNHQKLQDIERDLAANPPSVDQVEDLLLGYRRLVRQLYAQPHELALLRHFCAHDMQQIRRLQTALRQDIALHMQLLTDQVVLGEQTRLIFEIKNLGGRRATDLRFELEATAQAITLHDEPVHEVPELPGRGGRQRLDWRVLPQSAPLSIRLLCSFSNGQERRTETFEFSVPVIRKPGKGQGPRGGNPFQAGVAVFGDQFFGRHRELRDIFDLLLHGTTQPVLLRGPRRMGKTSLLRQIEYLLRREGELQRRLGYTREEEVRLRRWQPIATSLQAVHTEADVPGWYFDLSVKVAQAAGLAADRAVRRDDFDRDPSFTFERFLGNVLARHPTLHLLILLDEWDTQRHLEQFGGKLRALMQSGQMERVNWIFASTWMLSAEAGHFGSPFYAQTRSFELKEMAWEEAQTLLRVLSERAGITWQGEATVALLDQTALRPYLIQALAQRVYGVLASANPPFNVVDMEVVNTVISDFVQTSRGQGTPFAFLWEDRALTEAELEASLSWLGRLILLTIDREHPRPLKSVEIFHHLADLFKKYEGQSFNRDNLSDEIKENLTQLVSIFDVLKKEGDRFTFSIPLAQAWFHHAISQFEDPWQFAWAKLAEEHRLKRRLAK